MPTTQEIPGLFFSVIGIQLVLIEERLVRPLVSAEVIRDPILIIVY